VASALRARATFKLVVSTGLILIFLVSPLAAGWQAGDSQPITGPVILQLGSDPIVTDGAKQLAHYIDGAHLFHVPSLFHLKRIVYKTIGQIFYVGHGTEEGLVIGAELILWRHIEDIVADSPSQEHYFAACFSHLPGGIKGKIALGFEGMVDVDVATILLAAVAYGVHGLTNRLHELASDFTTKRGFEKLLKPERPLLSVTPVILEAVTPYGVVNPPAAQIHVTEAEVTQIQLLTLASAIIGLVAAIAGVPPVAIFSLYLVGIAHSLGLIWAHDHQGTYPDRYIIWWIPLDPFNAWLIGEQVFWYFKTPRFWWGCTLTYGYILGPG